MLGDLHLLDGLPQASSVPGAVLAGDPNLLGALGHPGSLSSENNHRESRGKQRTGKQCLRFIDDSMWLLRPEQEIDSSDEAQLPRTVVLWSSSLLHTHSTTPQTIRDKVNKCIEKGYL